MTEKTKTTERATFIQAKGLKNIKQIGQVYTTKEIGNLALHVGDVKEDVLFRRQKVSESIGKDLGSWVAGNQTHGCKIKRVEPEDRGKGAFDLKDAFMHTDAMICNKPNVVLSQYYADCVPILLADKKGQGIGIAHGGFQGTLRGIGVNTLKAMVNHYALQIENIFVDIGPSIEGTCYELPLDWGKDFLEKWPYLENVFQKGNNKKCFFDLKRANYLQMVYAGVPAENIHVSKYCTFCERESFFSYRRDKERAGRQGAFIWLKEI